MADAPPNDQVLPDDANVLPASAALPPPRRRGGFWIRVGVSVALLGVIALLGRRFYGDLGRLRDVNLPAIGGIAALYLATRVLNAAVIRSGLRRLGHRGVGRVELFGLLMIQYAMNMVIPRAGIGMPAAYLRLRRAVPVADFTAVQLLPQTIVMLGCVGLAGLAGQALVRATHGGFDLRLAALFLMVTLAAGAAIALGTVAARMTGDTSTGDAATGRRGAIAGFVRKLADANARLGRDRGLLLGSAVANVAVVLLRGVRLQLAFAAIGSPVGFAAALVASCASDVFFLVSLTPGALGFREGAIVYAARVMGTTGGVALSAALLDRIVISGCNVLFAGLAIVRQTVAASTATAKRLPN